MTLDHIAATIAAGRLTAAEQLIRLYVTTTLARLAVQ